MTGFLRGELGYGGLVYTDSMGMRAVSTKIKEETAAGNLILPNDRVDVILIRQIRDRTGQEDYVSDMLFGNVRVLAVGQQIETKEGKKQADGSATDTGGRSGGLAGPADKAMFAAIRGVADVIVAGAATVTTEPPRSRP